MVKVRITADSTCDLGDELAAQYNIGIIPLYIIMGDRSFKDNVEVKPAQMFEYFERTGELTKTAAVSVQDFIEFFNEQKQQGYDEILHFDISSEFSACYQNAVIAAQEVPGVYVVDSRNLSTGVGHLVLMGAELAQKGLSGPEIMQQVLAAVPRVDTSFVIDTLTYLHKGGRCSAVAALGANLLSLKPCIEVKNGRMVVGSKYRGTLKRCLGEYVRARLCDSSDIDPHRIFITHSTIPQELVEHVKEQIAACIHFDQVLETDAGSTVSGHCGPGCLGILYLHK